MFLNRVLTLFLIPCLSAESFAGPTHTTLVPVDSSLIYGGVFRANALAAQPSISHEVMPGTHERSGFHFRAMVGKLQNSSETRDFTIAGRSSNTQTVQEAKQFNEDAAIKPTLNALVKEIQDEKGIVVDRDETTGFWKLRETIEEHGDIHLRSGSVIKLQEVSVEIIEGGKSVGHLRIRGQRKLLTFKVLIIIDKRFQADHAGRNAFAAYATDEAMAAHEVAELVAVTGFALRGESPIASEQDIREGRLGTRLIDWQNPIDPHLKNERAIGLERLKRDWHIVGLQAELVARHPELHALEEGQWRAIWERIDINESNAEIDWKRILAEKDDQSETSRVSSLYFWKGRIWPLKGEFVTFEFASLPSLNRLDPQPGHVYQADPDKLSGVDLVWRRLSLRESVPTRVLVKGSPVTVRKVKQQLKRAGFDVPVVAYHPDKDNVAKKGFFYHSRSVDRAMDSVSHGVILSLGDNRWAEIIQLLSLQLFHQPIEKLTATQLQRLQIVAMNIFKRGQSILSEQASVLVDGIVARDFVIHSDSSKPLSNGRPRPSWMAEFHQLDTPSELRRLSSLGRAQQLILLMQSGGSMPRHELMRPADLERLEPALAKLEQVSDWNDPVALEEAIGGIMEEDERETAADMVLEEWAFEKFSGLPASSPTKPPPGIGKTLDRLIGLARVRIAQDSGVDVNPEKRAAALSQGARRVANLIVRGRRDSEPVWLDQFETLVRNAWDMERDAFDAELVNWILTDTQRFVSSNPFGYSTVQPRPIFGTATAEQQKFLIERTRAGLEELEAAVKAIVPSAMREEWAKDNLAERAYQKARLAKRMSKSYAEKNWAGVPQKPKSWLAQRNVVILQLQSWWMEGIVPSMNWLRGFNEGNRLLTSMESIFGSLENAYRAALPVKPEMFITISGGSQGSRKLDRFKERLAASKKPLTMELLHEAGLLQYALYLHDNRWPEVVKSLTGQLGVMPPLGDLVPGSANAMKGDRQAPLPLTSIEVILPKRWAAKTPSVVVQVIGRVTLESILAALKEQHGPDIVPGRYVGADPSGDVYFLKGDEIPPDVRTIKLEADPNDGVTLASFMGLAFPSPAFPGVVSFHRLFAVTAWAAALQAWAVSASTLWLGAMLLVAAVSEAGTIWMTSGRKPSGSQTRSPRQLWTAG